MGRKDEEEKGKSVRKTLRTQLIGHGCLCTVLCYIMFLLFGVTGKSVIVWFSELGHRFGTFF